MKFSLLVVTTNRLRKTERLFHSLAKQSYKNFEVVFVHEEPCIAEAIALGEKFAGMLDVRVVSVPVCGVSKARNLGLPLLGGDIAAFPDDDCVYPPDTLYRIAEFFYENPGVDVLLAGRAALTDAPTGSAEHGAPQAINRYALVGCTETFLQFYRKRCVETTGAFDERLGMGSGLPYGCGEDTDYALRAAQAGFTVVRASWIVVRHPQEDMDSPALAAKVASYARGRMYLLRKHAFPLWFCLANIAYPLLRLPMELARHGYKALPYRMRMFYFRLTSL
ncbi:MAG: glycosyltransferase [Desulfovibrio sp.]|nr:glycosyltransferase [Desulfovibrio sp.]